MLWNISRSLLLAILRLAITLAELPSDFLDIESLSVKKRRLTHKSILLTIPYVE